MQPRDVPLVLRRHAEELRTELRILHALGVLGELRHRVGCCEVGVAKRLEQRRMGVRVERVAALSPPRCGGR